MLLTVYTLGKFQITDGKAVINDNNLHSPMLSKLLMYMFLYRDKTLTTEDIANAIWQDEEVDNPAGALKNLMYRLRKCLEKNFGSNDFILTNRGSYKWNPDVEVILDIEEFEKLINEAKAENVCDIAVMKYEQVVNMYCGDFMTKLLDMHWIVTLNTYYHSLYLSSVKALADLYAKSDCYEELEKLCSIALKYDNVDEQLYCFQIEARMHTGKINLALESYEKAREIMEKELGIRKTTVLNKVYEELLSMSKGQTAYNINEVHDDIVEEDPQGVFFCGYPIFKEIYHLEARKCKRSKTPENLLLFTLETNKDDTREIQEFRIKKSMGVMEDTIKDCLRVGDVAAKYSDSQFVILLPTCNRALSLIVANRIVSKFYDKGAQYKNIKVNINLEDISDSGSIIE